MKLKLAVMEGNNKGEARTFEEGKFSIGRREDMDFVLDDQYVSREHFLLNISKQKVSILDLKSKGGTFVNGKRVRETELSDGDEIKIGKTRIAVRTIGKKYNDEGIEIGSEENGKLQLLVIEGINKGKTKSFGEGKFYIGREEGMDFVIDDEYVSRKHLSIDVSRGEIYISDLKSKNGTEVNGEKVGKTELSDGDEIKIGHTTILVRIKEERQRIICIHCKRDVTEEAEDEGIYSGEYICSFCKEWNKRKKIYIKEISETETFEELPQKKGEKAIEDAVRRIMEIMIDLNNKVLELNTECLKKECDIYVIIDCTEYILRRFDEIDVEHATKEIINELKDAMKELKYKAERGEELSETRKKNLVRLVKKLIDDLKFDYDKFLKRILKVR